MKKKDLIRNILLTLLVFGAVFALSMTQLLYSFDKLFSDPLYQRPGVPDQRIVILGIDEKTIEAYGDYTRWTREIPARLVEQLSADPSKAPAVIAFDVLYISDREEADDLRFAEACQKAGNVVTGANLVYKTMVNAVNGVLMVDEDHVSMVELPYEALRENSYYGFANTYLDRDQFVRYTREQAEAGGEIIPSFTSQILNVYAKRTGTETVRPKTDSRDLFQFTYTGKPGDYEVLSLTDVLEGRIDAAFLKDRIVLVGAYAPGLQDAYNAAVYHGGQMYGVEIQANILQAMMDRKTALPVNNLLYSLVIAFLAAGFFLLSRRLKPGPAACAALGLIGLNVLLGLLLYRNGHVIRLAELPLAVILIYGGNLAAGYLAEMLKKRRILAAFEKYVAPQVVQEVAGKGDFSITLGGERRHIAVLFVDIRGFTTMSEGLEPEQVVEILNEYLALTTGATFKNNGTLDKFIGDATMAVFNAPFDLDDYVYRAVCTARDIAAGSAELEKKLMERFGRSVSFGIGVNCGDAVVGNIGCDFRMDYTAIGDTVNTASRLESNAKRGQILISQAVKDELKDRIRVTDVGAIPLKGKSNEVYVYQLDEVL